MERIICLEMHIATNFFPPHPFYVRKSILEGFKAYWKDEIDLKELADKCYLRDIEGLYKYFSSFLNKDNMENM